MKPELHLHAKELFERARELPHEERERFLASECGEDRDLYREVRRLLDLAAMTPESYLSPGSRAETATAQGTLEPGTLLGRYRIDGRLGAGGMGEVYRATDPDLERQVALKVLPTEFSRDDERLERFQREAKALAALNHPGIVTIHSIEAAGGTRFLTMELVEGRTLDAAVPDAGLPLDRFFELAVPVVDALCAAHQARITHRDLKPANILLDPERLGKQCYMLPELSVSKPPQP